MDLSRLTRTVLAPYMGDGAYRPVIPDWMVASCQLWDA